MAGRAGRSTGCLRRRGRGGAACGWGVPRLEGGVSRAELSNEWRAPGAWEWLRRGSARLLARPQAGARGAGLGGGPYSAPLAAACEGRFRSEGEARYGAAGLGGGRRETSHRGGAPHSAHTTHGRGVTVTHVPADDTSFGFAVYSCSFYFAYGDQTCLSLFTCSSLRLTLWVKRTQAGSPGGVPDSRSRTDRRPHEPR